VVDGGKAYMSCEFVSLVLAILTMLSASIASYFTFQAAKLASDASEKTIRAIVELIGRQNGISK
jgi:hypothetical protein